MNHRKGYERREAERRLGPVYLGFLQMQAAMGEPKGNGDKRHAERRFADRRFRK